MSVYSSDEQHVGHIAEIYEDSFLVHKGYFFPTDRYIPYDAIGALAEDRVTLTLSVDQIEDRLWETRPDYEDHPGDPTQIMYDKGHGLHDSFDEASSEQS